MARQNIRSTRTKPLRQEPVELRVLRRERISPGFSRVTMAGAALERFQPLGFDQWFRLFIPVADDSLRHVPQAMNMRNYLRYLTVSPMQRPVTRNYSVRRHREAGADGAEIDVDFALHGSEEDGSAGPATRWALSCEAGDPVALLDEGITFDRSADVGDIALVADETAVPAAAGILASLPDTAAGRAVIEVGSAEDRQDLAAPPGIDLSWIVRPGGATPGQAALDAVRSCHDAPTYGWAAGEQAMVTGARRHWVSRGTPKERVTFCGYWRQQR